MQRRQQRQRQLRTQCSAHSSTSTNVALFKSFLHRHRRVRVPPTASGKVKDRLAIRSCCEGLAEANGPGCPSKINRSFLVPTAARRESILLPPRLLARRSSSHIFPLLHFEGLNPVPRQLSHSHFSGWWGGGVFIKHDLSPCRLRR